MSPGAFAVRPADSALKWPVRHPWLVALGSSLVPVVFTAGGFAVAQVRGLDDLGTYLTVAATVTVSALVGLLIMWRARPSLTDFGHRTPRNAARALWWVPSGAVVALVLLGSGVAVRLAVVPAIAWLAIAVGLNEEFFYRGVVFKVMRRYGTRRAIVYSALIFGVLHLANLGNGSSAGYLVLQVVFSALFGFVTAELVAVTGSLWPGVAFHAAYDTVAYLGGDSSSTTALVSLAVQVVLLGAYGWWLWRRLPRAEVSA
jgi:uncharacterized protein